VERIEVVTDETTPPNPNAVDLSAFARQEGGAS
jgi:hypothetical protein